MSTQAESLVARLGGSARERAAAYADLENTRDGVLGACCVGALAAVLEKSASEVDTAEYHRCCLVLAHLAALDPERVGGEYFIDARSYTALTAGNAADVVLSIGTEELTKDNVRTLAVGQACMPAMWASGWDPVATAAGGLDFMEWWGAANMYGPLKSDQAKGMRVVTLALDLLREDCAEMTEAERAGVWNLLMWLSHEYGEHAVHEGVAGLVVKELTTASPCDWVSIDRNPSGRFGFVFYFMVEMIFTANAELKYSLAATTGLLDVFLDVLRAYESAGPDGANVTSVFMAAGALFFMHDAFFKLDHINRTAVEAAAGQIRYLLDHPLVWAQDYGWTTSQSAVCICQSPNKCKYLYTPS